MKKIAIFMFILLIMPLLKVDSTPPSAPDGIHIIIQASSCQSDTFNDGYIDLLVKRDEVTQRILETRKYLYNERYGHILNIDYMENDSEWISYLAFIEEANLILESSCSYLFATNEDEYKQFNHVKLVYFNEQGQTLYLSDEITLIHPNQREARYGEIIFVATEPYKVLNNYTISNPTLSFVLIILISILAFPFYLLSPIGTSFGILATMIFWAALIMIFIKFIKRHKKNH